MSQNELTFEFLWKQSAQEVDAYIATCLPELTVNRLRKNILEVPSAVNTLFESISYSLSASGKRFRPILTLWSLEALKHDRSGGLPFAAAVEFVHCYSLIHDDLPCMDNDDFRRGRPSNHKVYGEAVALLAGNTLLTAAFTLIAESYPAEQVKPLARLLSHAAGFCGMLGGQAIDMELKQSFTAESLKTLHELKTGAMIRVAAEGAALIGNAEPLKSQQIVRFAELLGHAFQVADDLLDYIPGQEERQSYVSVIGYEATVGLLKDLTEQAIGCLSDFGPAAQNLRDMAQFNLVRKT